MSVEFFMRHLGSSTLRNVILRALLAWFIQFVDQRGVVISSSDFLQSQRCQMQSCITFGD